MGSALGNPLAAGPAAAGLAGIAATFAALRAEVHHAATQAATTLGAASIASSQDGASAGAGDADSYETAPLDDRDIAWIRRQADGNVSWPDVRQGTIGDCYLLATLQAYSDTEEGRQALRDQVRWEESQNAFVVTFHDGDQEVEITVDDYYTSGNQENKNGYPSIINIYERAYAEYLKDHTSDNTLAGGWPGEAMESISGEGTQTVSTDGWGWGRWGFLPYPRHYNQHEYTEEEWDTIEEAVEERRPVVGSTSGGDFDGKGAEVEATVDANGDGVIDSEEANSPEQRLIVGGEWDGQKGEDGHAYTVVAVDEEHVTLYNPWDTNPDENGKNTGGGTIQISREDYERYFARTDIGQAP
ncbi:cysteine protease [Actinomyces sp. 2119]|uniref:C2 family cysteine protease n=1 Tax=Actinomyces sp. 2119 TaxID=2321393 RepID=UPI000E6CAD83|nr:C2 family cysteine protease [Actinomyces sp. 2119]RJF40171.1 cysteine protease [Actinomyces sp. 2119]